MLDDSETLLAVAEALRAEMVELILTYMAEGCMAQVVAQGDGLRQVLVEIQSPGNGAGYLSNLQGVGEAGDVMVAQRRDEDLGLVFEAAKSLTVDDAIPVALELGADRGRFLGDHAAPTTGGPGGVGREGLFSLLQVMANRRRNHDV